MTLRAALVTTATDLLERCREKGILLATAESCTGGLIAATLTEVAGSSDVVDRGFVTYSNAAKTELLGVPADLIEEVGAVSEQVARAMAKGALARSRADVTVSVTGVAGPGGGSEEKPVGLVHFAAARTGHPTLHREKRFGDVGRGEVRLASVEEAFSLIEEILARP
ncbi:CinA family protein [Amorphus orientalis]|uniref:Nicotinamide-nucleotide amidase n=1 Tax=Amorphus orientalis TaxID=649198 RepID=A0AAE3VTP5_9HYPH|nr:CinA family protein [Amorphus orientalis]MDQ0317650.1 nicotinamide-nucleotide amidase [Amorphus orientalis]